MKKQVFIAAITALQKQNELDSKNAELLAQVFPESDSANVLYPNHYLTNTLLEVIHEGMGDTFRDKAGMTWTEYFCFEIDFGRQYKPGMVRDKDNINIDISTPAKLYDFLIDLKS